MAKGSQEHVEPKLDQLPSGRHGLPREYILESQRTRLLGAAIRVAGTKGYAAMTVSAVIARAGVSRKTFYEFFDDREACFLAAHDLVVERAIAETQRAYASAETWPEQVRAALAWALRALAAYPHQARFAFVEVLAVGPRALERRDAAMRAFMRFLEPGHDAAPAGVKIPPLMPEAIVGALCEIVSTRVRHGQTAELPDLLPQLLYCALAPFIGPAAAQAASGRPARARGSARAGAARR